MDVKFPVVFHDHPKRSVRVCNRALGGALHRFDGWGANSGGAFPIPVGEYVRLVGVPEDRGKKRPYSAVGPGAYPLS